MHIATAEQSINNIEKYLIYVDILRTFLISQYLRNSVDKVFDYWQRQQKYGDLARKRYLLAYACAIQIGAYALRIFRDVANADYLQKRGK